MGTSMFKRPNAEEPIILFDADASQLDRIGRRFGLAVEDWERAHHGLLMLWEALNQARGGVSDPPAHPLALADELKHLANVTGASPEYRERFLLELFQFKQATEGPCRRSTLSSRYAISRESLMA